MTRQELLFALWEETVRAKGAAVCLDLIANCHYRTHLSHKEIFQGLKKNPAVSDVECINLLKKDTVSCSTCLMYVKNTQSLVQYEYCVGSEQMQQLLSCVSADHLGGKGLNSASLHVSASLHWTTSPVFGSFSYFIFLTNQNQPVISH